MKKRILTISGIAISVVVLSMLILLGCRAKKASYTIETVKVAHGNISNTVTATGTIQALKTVAVGTQVSGVINKLYVDFNSVVKKGQLLAELDKVPLQAGLDNAKASLDNAKATLTYQEANYNRVKALHDKKLVAESDYDQALYNYSTAKASMKIAESGYDKAKINLDYATIYSPIDGVVLNRAVDEGQTVAASFSTPTLFSIANDLTQMQVAANIDETDIGQVKVGQRVEFTVNAYTGTKFKGEVTEIRLQSTTTSNVVTYTVIIKAPNPDRKLLPGLTADITIYVQEASNVITIPLKATQFFPDSATIAGYLNSLPENQRPEFKKPEKGNRPGGMAFSKEKGMKPGSMPFSAENAPKMVWIKTDKSIHPIPVEVGINDGVNTEVTKGLNEGDDVIVNISLDGGGFKPGAASGSPFMPKPPQAKTPSKK